MVFKKKLIAYFGVVSIVILCILSVIALASYPPEWVGASGANITIGDEVDGTDYTDTFYTGGGTHDIVAEKDGCDYEVIVFYKFAGKCSKVKIYISEAPSSGSDDYEAWAYYTDSSYESLGTFSGYEYYGVTFDLNSNKYLKNIKIRSLAEDVPNCPPKETVKVDYIRAYCTGIL